MPLYMDFHTFPRITIDEAKKAHVADEQIQNQYGVKYLQFWVNEQAGNLFCLVEGPDKSTVESVHRIAHGHTACAIVEVDPSYYSLVMGNNIRIDHGLVHHESGQVDLGYRFISVVSVHGKPSDSRDSHHMNTIGNAHDLLLSEVEAHRGRVLRVTGDDSLVSVFNSAEQALNSARAIQEKLLAESRKHPISFSIGLSAGQPVTRNNEFIEETITLARRLGSLAGEGRMLVSSLFDELCHEKLLLKENLKIRILNAGEETFLADVFNIIDTQIANENFTIESLVKTVGISRPQLYRKIHALTGRAPNNLLRDMRLEKAWSLLKRKTGNISEVSFDVGFSNPSYFAKCFARKFGCLPSRIHAPRDVEEMQTTMG